MKKEDLGGETTDVPNEHYRKFFEKFKEIEKLDPKDWKTAHLISYFCKKYKEQYNVNYQFKYNNTSPSKCFEVFQIKKLAQMLTSDSSILKEYIDWVYENKVIKAKRRLTSISFMTVEGVVNEYKFNVLLASKNVNNTIERTTPLPKEYQAIFIEAKQPITTYGELAFISQMSGGPLDLCVAFEKLYALGFDKNILGRIV